MARYNGVNHLAMATGDMDTTIRFWRDLLGMRLVAGVGQPGYRHYFFEISAHDLIAFDHVSIGVESEDDLWAVKDRLEAAGIRVSDVVDHGFIHSIYTFDPNGIPLEFSHNVEGVDVRRNPAMEDVAPSPVTLEGAEPQPGKWPEVTQPTRKGERVVYAGAGSELFHGKK